MVETEQCKPMRHCLACGSGRLVTYCDLGEQPLANSYHDGTVDLPEFPLAINVCEVCWHSQLTHSVAPELLFKDYAYVSGTTATLSDYFDGFVQKVIDEFPYRCLSVMDIAGNDGSLLSKFGAKGHDVLNVDPAANLTAISEANGVTTLCEFWTVDTPNIIGKKYDALIAMNVLGHVSNPHGFLIGCRNALADGGRLWVQTSQCRWLQNGEFDCAYMEHASYFSALSFLTLAARSGLTVLSVDIPTIHGSSYLWKLGLDGNPDPSVDALLDYENDCGLYESDTYVHFGAKAAATATWLYQVVDEYRDAGYSCVGYGAAAKAMTMLNFSQVNLDWIVDDNPMKQGSFTPGGNTPIVGVDFLERIKTPLCIVITAWNFSREIVQRIRAVRQNDDDVFVRYFPNREIWQ